MRKFLVFLPLLLLVGSAMVISQEGDSNQAGGNLTSNNFTVTDAAADKSLELVLSKTSYLPNETVSGMIRIRLNGTIGSDRIVAVLFNNKLYNSTLKALLSSANISFTIAPSVIEAVNPGSMKLLKVDTDVPAMIAMKMPSGIERVESVSLGLRGDLNNQLLNPNFDVGNDGELDWYYLGNFKEWKQEYALAGDLKETSEEQAKIRNNLTYYCELIEVPRTKDIKVFVKYKKLSAAGDARAAVFSPVGGDPTLIEGEGITCDFPEQAALQYASCDIHLDYAAKGSLQVCVYSQVMGESDSDLYQVSTDALEPTASAFNCNPHGGTGGLCSPRNNGDYYIKVQAADYTNNLVGDIDFGAWGTFPNSVAQAIERYVGTEVQEGSCKDPICTVPITIRGKGTGLLNLHDLNVAYSIQGSSNVAATIYGIRQENPLILSISGNDLSTTPLTLEFPLSMFGELRANMPAFAFSDESLQIKFNNGIAGAKIRVYKDKIPLSDIQKQVDDASRAIGNALANADMSKMLKIMQLDAKMAEDKSKLDTYFVMLASGNALPSLDAEIESYLADVPKAIRLKKSLADRFVAEPNDVSSDMKSTIEGDELYAFQFNAEVMTRIKIYELQYPSGDTKTVMMVMKAISPKSPLSKVTVYESIPKSVAQSADGIKFEQTPSKIINADPLVSWYFPELKETEISYAAETTADVPIFELKTIIAPTQVEEKPVKEEVPESVCGDGVCELEEDAASCPDDCKKFDWNAVVIGALALLAVGFYFMAFSNPANFRKAALGDMPFKRADHLLSVENYIAGMKSKGVADGKIFAALKQNKWSDSQIKFAFGAMNVDRQLDARLKQVPPKQRSGSAMKQYLVAGLQRGVDFNVVSSYLMKAGWQEGEIGSAYLSARIAMPFALALSKIGIKLK